MKLKDYIKELQMIADKYPNALVVSASDEEGNCHSEVVYSPTLGHFNKKTGDFDPFEDEGKSDAVCIN